MANKTVIFDFDGTLANTIDLVIRIYNEHASSFGSLQVETSELDSLRALGYKKALKAKRIRWSSLPKLVLLVSREMKQHMSEVKPYDGIVEALHELRRQDISIGVLTSNNASLVQDFFDAHGFPKFDFLVSERTIFGKDKALNKIIKRWGLDRKEVMYVGDEPRDVTACLKAKVTVVGVTWGLGGRRGLLDTPPDYLVDTTQELLQVLSTKDERN